MTNRVLMADMVIDPETVYNASELEINLELRYSPGEVGYNHPAGSGPRAPGQPMAGAKGYGRIDYDNKNTNNNGQGHASVRVDSVNAKVTTRIV